MSKLDRFAEDYKKMETLERMIKENLKERATQIKMGNSAGKVTNSYISIVLNDCYSIITY